MMKAKTYPQKKLRTLIDNSGLTIKEIANKWGCTDKNVYQRIKRPELFTVPECEQFAEVLGIDTIEVIRCVIKL